MSRKEYMEQLAYLLQDIPDDEREEALAWYEDYFEEAGAEQEDEVIQKLGSPEKVAALIKDGLNGGNDEAGEYTDAGYQDGRFREDYKVPEKSYQYDRMGVKKKEKRGRGEILLLILIGILALPVVLPLLASAVGVVFALLGTLLAIVCAIAAGTIAAVAAGVVCIGAGIAKVILSPGAGFLLLGGGLLSLAIGILLLTASLWAFGKFLPWTVRKITELIGKFLKRGGHTA